MDILVEFDFPDGMEYFALGNSSIEWEGKQYLNVVAAVSGYSENMGDNKSFEVSNISIQCYDYDDHFRSILNSSTNRFLNGRTVYIRDTEGILIQKMNIETWSLVPYRINFVCSNKLNPDDFTEKVTLEVFPEQESGVLGTVIPMVYNTVTELPVYEIDKNVVGVGKLYPGNWMLGLSEILDITKVDAGGIYKDANPDLFSLKTSGKYWLMAMWHGVVLLHNDRDGGGISYVDLTTPPYDPVGIIKDILETKTGIVTIAPNVEFKSFLAAKGYNSSNVRFVVNASMTVTDLLTQFCQCFECNYRFNVNNEIEFTFIDTGDIEPDIILYQDEIIEFSDISFDPQNIKNKIRYYYDYDYRNGKYKGYGEYDADTQDKWGVRTLDINFPFLTEATQALATAERIARLNKEPTGSVQVKVNLELGFDIKTGVLIYVAHEDAKKPGYPVLYQVVRKNVEFDNETVTLDLVEIEFMAPPSYLLQEEGSALLMEDGSNIVF